MADYSPVFSGGAVPFAATTAGAVTGGRVLAASATGVVTHAAADSTVAVGVAAHDAASGAIVTVWPLDGVVHRLEASGAIAALAGVVTDAAGKVQTAVIATNRGRHPHRHRSDDSRRFPADAERPGSPVIPEER